MAAGLRATAPRIPFGAERRGTFTPPEPHPTCHDCGVRPGELHSEGCDVEECETCGGQRIGCYCCHVCRAHEKHGTWSVCAECIALAKQARLRGAPTPAMIAAALEYYDGNVGASPADRRVAATWMGELLRAALTAQDLPTEEQPTRQPEP